MKRHGPSILALLTSAPALALACLNDFEISLAEQQLRGAYAAPVSASAPWPLTGIIAGLGAVVLLVGLIRAARAA